MQYEYASFVPGSAAGGIRHWGTILPEQYHGCLDEGLYPAWDAANKVSVRLAEKLGYEFSREYVCYVIK